MTGVFLFHIKYKSLFYSICVNNFTKKKIGTLILLNSCACTPINLRVLKI